jgi:GntR family transcriptional regulator
MQRGSPKYSQIVDRILSDIRAGTYGIGDMLPAEHRLMDAYSVSRHTVRQALQSLKQIGVIEARQGKGSIVIATATDAALVERIQSIEALIEMGGDLNRRLLSKRKIAADAVLAEAFDTQVGREFIEFHLLRYLAKNPEVPIAYLKAWIDPLFEPITAMVEDDGRTMVELMKVHYDREIGSIRQTVTAWSLDEIVAGHLDRPAGEAALQVERRYYESASSPAHLRTISICRGDMVQIESHFQSS